MPQALRSPGFTVSIPANGLMRYYHSFRNVIPHKEVGSPRVTHPSAMHPLPGTSDLHVLGTPPAFILSQDQTLMFNLYAHNRSEDRSGYLLLFWLTPSFDKANSKAPILSIRLSKTPGFESGHLPVARRQLLQLEPLGPRHTPFLPQPQSRR